MTQTKVMDEYEKETDENPFYVWHGKEFPTDDYINWIEEQYSKIKMSYNKGKLRPCPFCGKYPTIHNEQNFWFFSHVCTENKGIEGVGMSVNCGLLTSEKDAIDAWNRRV